MPKPLLFSRCFLPALPNLVRTRFAIGCSFFVQGFTFATWCTRIPDIQAKFALSEAALGSVLLMLPLGQFLAMGVNGGLVAKFGSRKLLLLAGFAYPTLLLAIGLAPNLLLLNTLLFLAGAIANLSNTAVNTQAVQLEHYYKRTIITLFHGMWSIGGLVAVCLKIAMTWLNISTVPHFLLTAASCILLLSFSGGALMSFDRKPPPKAPGETFSLSFLPPLLWIGIAAFGCMACEGTIYDWNLVYMQEALQLPETQQNFGYFAYLCTMVSGRFISDALVNRFGIRAILTASAVTLLVGFLVLIGASHVSESLTLTFAIGGCALAGIGTCAVVPLCCSLAGKCQTIPPSISIAIISTIGFFGLLVTPPLIGYIAHQLSLQTAFLFMAGLSVLVLIATNRVTRKQASV